MHAVGRRSIRCHFDAFGDVKAIFAIFLPSEFSFGAVRTLAW
jgi:hypothetical protein